MANRYFNQFPQSLEKKVCNIFLKAAIGASGAPTIDAVNSKGIISMVRTAAGRYTIRFGTLVPLAPDTYVKLLGAYPTWVAGLGISASPNFGILTTANSLGVGAGNFINVQFSVGGVATDLASGEVIRIQFVLGDSTAP